MPSPSEETTTAAEIMADAYTIHAINILRVAAGQRQAVMDALQKLERDLVRKIGNSPTLNSQARLRALLDQTRGSITNTYAAIAENHVAELADLAQVEATQTANIVGDAIGVDITTVGLSEKQLEKITDGKTIFGFSSADWWKSQDTNLQRKFQQAMQQAMLLGEGTDEMIRRVRGTAANSFNDGIMAVSRRDAAALVRTSAISTANSARLATMEGMQDVMNGVEWLATLDSRTSVICRALSGKRWKYPDYEPVGHDKKFPGPSAHWLCRSSPIPWTKSWEELSGKKLPSIGDQELEEAVKKKLAARGMSQKQIDAATVRSRASMDGPVPESLTMDKFLEGKDDTFIDDTLGPGRAKLWDRGKGNISLSDLTDQNNRPLSISQLKDLADHGTPVPETLGVEYLTMNPNGQYVREAPDSLVQATSTAASHGIARAKADGLDLTPEQEQVMTAMTAAERRKVTRLSGEMRKSKETS